MLYLRAQSLCYRVSPDQGPILSFSQSQFSGPIFTAEGKSWAESHYAWAFPCRCSPQPSPVISLSAHSSKPSSMLSRLDIKVQTLATEHRRRYEVWCSNQCTLSMAELFSFICSISCLQRSWEAMQICHSMKCYMIFGLCGLVTHKIISQSIILFQTTNVFLGLGLRLRPPGPISGFAISIWDLPFRLFIFWQLKVRLPMLPMRCYNLPLVKIWALAPSPGLCTI